MKIKYEDRELVLKIKKKNEDVQSSISNPQ
jgi:hypothetical protein